MACDLPAGHTTDRLRRDQLCAPWRRNTRLQHPAPDPWGRAGPASNRDGCTHADWPPLRRVGHPWAAECALGCRPALLGRSGCPLSGANPIARCGAHRVGEGRSHVAKRSHRVTHRPRRDATHDVVEPAGSHSCWTNADTRCTRSMQPSVSWLNDLPPSRNSMVAVTAWASRATAESAWSTGASEATVTTCWTTLRTTCSTSVANDWRVSAL